MNKPIDLSQNTGANVRAASVEANAMVATLISSGNSSGPSAKYTCTSQGSDWSGCTYYRCVDNDNTGASVIGASNCNGQIDWWYLD